MATFTNESKNNSSYSNESKNTSAWDNGGFLLQENGDFLLQENGFKIVLEPVQSGTQKSSTTWTNESKN